MIGTNETAPQRWTKLDGARGSFIRRCEQYASYTIPKLCTPDGYDQNSSELMHDYQSLGAQGVNHAANKLMLALFAPSRTFFRLDPGPKMLQQLAAINVSEQDVADQLAVAEKEACKTLDRKALRPKLYEAAKHLLVTGNALLIFGKDDMRVSGIKGYCVKRAANGKWVELILREKVPVAALEPAVKALVMASGVCTDQDHEVVHYYWGKLQDDGRYYFQQYIDDIALPDKFSSYYTEDKVPYHPITWDLSSCADYGTGLVEDYSGDFGSLSLLSEATVKAAILASEFRWLVNPQGMTKVEDFAASRNGDALPGNRGDIELLSSGKGADFGVNVNVAQEYIRRIGAAFLLNSAVTRDAERVTAEEIKLTAEELETSWGGAYSRIAVDMQIPMATWLMSVSNMKIAGTDLRPTVLTGLDALSRSGDRDSLVLFLQDLTALNTLPPEVRNRIKLSSLMTALAAARGISSATYVMTDMEFAALQQQQMQMQAQQQAAQAGNPPTQEAQPNG